MICKRPLDSRHLRSKPPRGFGWIDHRLLREGYLARCTPPALALYCLLVCASDSQGMSFYRDEKICETLGMESDVMRSARRGLQALGLIAFQSPLYQLLEIGEAVPIARDKAVLRPPSGPAKLHVERGGLAEAAAPAVALKAAADGLDLRAMVRAALREGGAA